MVGGAIALAPSDSIVRVLVLAKAKALVGKNKTHRYGVLVRSAVLLCLDIAKFVRDRTTSPCVA